MILQKAKVHPGFTIEERIRHQIIGNWSKAGHPGPREIGLSYVSIQIDSDGTFSSASTMWSIFHNEPTQTDKGTYKVFKSTDSWKVVATGSRSVFNLKVSPRGLILETPSLAGSYLHYSGSGMDDRGLLHRGGVFQPQQYQFNVPPHGLPPHPVFPPSHYQSTNPYGPPQQPSYPQSFNPYGQPPKQPAYPYGQPYRLPESSFVFN